VSRIVLDFTNHLLEQVDRKERNGVLAKKARDRVSRADVRALEGP
jgi:hypothetical protein